MMLRECKGKTGYSEWGKKAKKKGSYHKQEKRNARGWEKGDKGTAKKFLSDVN